MYVIIFFKVFFETTITLIGYLVNINHVNFTEYHYAEGILPFFLKKNSTYIRTEQTPM